MIYFLLFVFVIPAIFHFVTRYNRRARIIRKISGPTAYPIFGNLLMFNVNCMSKFWDIAREASAKYYPITRFWVCTVAIVSVRHPDDMQILLSSQKVIEKGYIYEYLRPWLKSGLLTSTGDKWRHRRKMLTPAFHFNILNRYIQISINEGKKLVDSLKFGAKEKEESLEPMCTKYTLNVICESAMGINLDSIDSESATKYKNAVHDMGKIVIYRMPRPYISTWMMPFIYKMGNVQRNALKTLNQFTNRVINMRKEYHKRNHDESLENLSNEIEKKTIDNVDAIGKKKRLAMLDLLLVAQKKGAIDDKGIKEEVDTFTFEGHDTTGMAMTFLLFLLAENKNVQDCARTEVTELLLNNDGKVDAPVLQQMDYLDRCIKEALRLYPPVSTIMRYTEEDIQLVNALVPAHTHLFIHIYDAHRDPNFWSDPDKFDPDRFLPINSQHRHPFAYVPFSAGPRNCIGQKFATTELKAVVAQLLYDFYLEPIDRIADMKIIADIVIRPLKPIRLKFIKIDK